VAGRLAVAYIAVFVVGVSLASTSLVLGAGRDSQPQVAGVYRASGPCLGGVREFQLEQSGQFVDASGALEGKLRYRRNRLTGDVRCAGRAGTQSRLDATRLDSPGGRRMLRGTLGSDPFRAVFVHDLAKPGVVAVPASAPPGEQVFGRLMLAIAAVILAARLVGAAIGRLGQPPVMGEVLAGILLGPTLLGAIAPSVRDYLFPTFVIPLLSGAANIGLAFYMFLVGLELDPRMLRGRIAHAAAISNASVVLPMGVGIFVALPLFGLLAPPDTTFQAFALFMGVAMSITAFPVLARILIERRMLRTPIGALALSSAAVDDVTAWGLLAIASAVAGHGSALGTLPVLGYVFAFCAGMALLARPLLNRVSTAYDEAGRVPAGWISAIFVGVLLSAYVSMKSGIAPIFGAFVMGLVMPRRADLSHDVTRRLEDFVATVLLPLFFVVTGLRTDIGLLNRPELWGLALLVLAVAIAGKWLGAMVIARVAGYRMRDSAILGVLMNTRGLTELIVLNVGLELGVISRALFTILVLMALVTTFMAAPCLRLLDRRRELAAPVEDELLRAEGEPLPEAPHPERTIVVAPLEERNVDELLALAEPLARANPPTELLVVRLLEPPRVPTGLAAQERELDRTRLELGRLREALAARGIPARSLALISADRGNDLVRLAAEQGGDLILVDGRRPLLGAGVPKGDVATVLEKGVCDVAVLIERERIPPIDGDHPVVVRFAGHDDDQSALELGGQIAAEMGAVLRVLEPPKIAADAAGAGLVILGLGSGPVTAAKDAPTLFVRRAPVASQP
jgi:Kef-type K+ transport system membrane component KefB